MWRCGQPITGDELHHFKPRGQGGSTQHTCRRINAVIAIWIYFPCKYTECVRTRMAIQTLTSTRVFLIKRTPRKEHLPHKTNNDRGWPLLPSQCPLPPQGYCFVLKQAQRSWYHKLPNRPKLHSHNTLETHTLDTSSRSLPPAVISRLLGLNRLGLLGRFGGADVCVVHLFRCVSHDPNHFICRTISGDIPW